MVDATTMSTNLVRDLDGRHELENRIESLDCRCPGNPNKSKTKKLIDFFSG